MYFDFESRRFETPTVESAMSYRECALLSLFTHLLIALLVLVGPRLPFVQEAMERRAEQLAELAKLAEAEQLALRQVPDDAPEFIFVDTLVDPPAPAPPPEADLSDLDRVAQSPTQADDPLNDLPNAEGNSFEFMQTPDPADGFDPLTSLGEETERAAAAPAPAADGFEDGSPDAVEPEESEPEAREEAEEEEEGEAALAAGERWARRPLGDRPGTILNRALRGLDSVARNQTYYNLRGRTDSYGPDIQFDSRGVDFGSWLRRFRSQIYRNWFIPLRRDVDVRERRPDVQRPHGRHADGPRGRAAIGRRRVHQFGLQRDSRVEPDLPAAPGVSRGQRLLHGDVLLQRAAAGRLAADPGMTEPPKLTDRQQLGLLILLTVVLAMALLG